MNNKKRNLRLNTIFGLVYQIVAIISGFILPRLILKTYGSEVNGLVNSIQSILNVITLMELGVGAVVQTALYKPLASGDNDKVRRIIQAAKNYFRIVGIGFVVFVIAVCLAYPFYVRDSFEIYTTVLLIVSISITLFAQYFFGLVNGLLLQADQKVFVYNIIQIIALVLNTISCVVLILCNVDIVIVKFVTSLVFLLRPLLLFAYVKKNYDLYKVKVEGDELPQKWNGVAQHIASYVLDNTDIVVLTLLASLSDVSIYSTYYLVAGSIRLLIVSLTNGIQAYYGNLYANDNLDGLKNEFERFNFYIHSFSTLVFSITCVMIVPFVMCYTTDVNDANYNQFLFAVFLVLGQYMYCLRRSFNLLILAAGHYKETQLSAILEAAINVVVSVVLVFFFGLVGVAIGTAVAMLFRVIYFALYCSKHIINRSFTSFIKDILVDLFIYGCAICGGYIINTRFEILDYFNWVVYSFIVTGIMLVICLFIFFIFYRKLLLGFFMKKRR